MKYNKNNELGCEENKHMLKLRKIKLIGGILWQ
jgi:hypothetical protein